MFDTPELDDIIFRHLSLNSAVKCSYVCKKWHRDFTPLIWRDINIDRLIYTGRVYMFCSIVDEDLEMDKEKQESNNSNTVTKTPTTILATHGQYIRSISRRFPAQIPQSIVRHFFKRCPRVQIRECIINTRDVKSPGSFKTVVNMLAPAAQHLWIGHNGLDTSKTRSPSTATFHARKLARILYAAASTSVVKKLTLNFEFSGIFDEKEDGEEDDEEEDEIEDEDEEEEYEGEEKEEEEIDVFEGTEWPVLKLEHLTELVIGGSDADRVGSKFWGWLWPSCGNVKALTVYSIYYSSVLFLGMHISKHMKNLESLQIGYDAMDEECGGYDTDDGFENEDRDEMLASLIYSFQLKCLRCYVDGAFGRRTLKVLRDHYATIQELSLTGTLKAKHVVEILTYCGNLHRFELLHDGVGSYTRILAHEFADVNHGTFAPWNCQSSLKVLKIGITVDTSGIDYTSIALQRISLLKNLEVLWLGRRFDKRNVIEKFSGDDDDDDGYDAVGNKESYYDGEPDDDWLGYIVSMKLKLGNGLEYLGRLKKLREFGVADLNHEMQAEEVDWIHRQWPNLHFIGCQAPEAEESECDEDESECDSEEDESEDVKTEEDS
ncbi:hypothetical protein BG004_001966 [Podila humilis]|nr:hypothetical protein BG004_001966 [Podila humilis]